MSNALRNWEIKSGHPFGEGLTLEELADGAGDILLDMPEIIATAKAEALKEAEESVWNWLIGKTLDNYPLSKDKLHAVIFHDTPAEPERGPEVGDVVTVSWFENGIAKHNPMIWSLGMTCESQERSGDFKVHILMRAVEVQRQIEAAK